MTPAPQLTPEIREKFLADLDYLLIAQETHAPNGLRPLERGIMQLVESAILALSGPPSGQESRDTVLLDWLEESHTHPRRYGDGAGWRWEVSHALGISGGPTLREAIENAISAEIVDEAGEGGFDTEERP